ncbi:MAG: hypothetical protein EA414_18615 [Arthrospira sp. PLM2.Bin9]|nr:MAG: hypothetical protein EA414_18615 [Arthrospira sp. PLM2.Bin9]
MGVATKPHPTISGLCWVSLRFTQPTWLHGYMATKLGGIVFILSQVFGRNPGSQISSNQVSIADIRFG